MPRQSSLQYSLPAIPHQNNNIRLLKQEINAQKKEIETLKCCLKVTLFAIVAYTLWLGWSYLYTNPQQDL